MWVLPQNLNFQRPSAGVLIKFFCHVMSTDVDELTCTLTVLRLPSWCYVCSISTCIGDSTGLEVLVCVHLFCAGSGLLCGGHLLTTTGCRCVRGDRGDSITTSPPFVYVRVSTCRCLHDRRHCCHCVVWQPSDDEGSSLISNRFYLSLCVWVSLSDTMERSWSCSQSGGRKEGPGGVGGGGGERETWLTRCRCISWGTPRWSAGWVDCRSRCRWTAARWVAGRSPHSLELEHQSAPAAEAGAADAAV